MADYTKVTQDDLLASETVVEKVEMVEVRQRVSVEQLKRQYEDILNNVDRLKAEGDKILAELKAIEDSGVATVGVIPEAIAVTKVAAKPI